MSDVTIRLPRQQVRLTFDNGTQDVFLTESREVLVPYGPAAPGRLVKAEVEQAGQWTELPVERKEATPNG